MRILLIIIAIYLLSNLRNYYWFKNSHSKGGVFHGLDIDWDVLLFAFTPVLNTIFAISCTFFSINGKKYKGNLNKFFNVNK